MVFACGFGGTALEARGVGWKSIGTDFGDEGGGGKSIGTDGGGEANTSWCTLGF